MTRKSAAARKEELLEGLGDEVQAVNEVDTTPKNQVLADAPERLSPEWNDYVLSLFSDDEKFNGRPKAHGLRRVAQLLCGRIVSSIPAQVFPPTEKFVAAATVWRVEFENGDVFGDVADCNVYNTDEAFVAYALATSATRAEARALRKALNLSTAAAEEMTEKDTTAIVRAVEASKPSTGEIEDKDRMTDAQANLIRIKCKQIDVDPVKFFKDVMKVNPHGLITKKLCSASIDKLNGFQQNAETIPEAIVGYTEGWRT